LLILLRSDKKTATTFALVHRPQNDPKIHDDDASSMVFKEMAAPNQKGRDISDTASIASSLDLSHIRDNEGEAAIHGVYFDDTEYDYMQHMRDLNSTSEAYFVDASDPKPARKQKLEDALRDVSLDDASSSVLGKRPRGAPLLDSEILPNRNLRIQTYQDQQDVPDVLAGFQPDMDPRLREALEALEDDAFVDEEDDGDLFTKLAGDGEELTLDEFEDETGDLEDDDEGWESDQTTKPSKEYKGDSATGSKPEAGEEKDTVDPNWMSEFAKFKKANGKSKGPKDAPSQSDLQSSALTSSSMGPKRKRRKGALTNTSSYSMTSSSLFRTEKLTLLDDRFDKIEEAYAEDDDDAMNGDHSFSETASQVSGRFDDAASFVSTASSTMTQDNSPANFDNIMDDFLSDYGMQGKRRVKKGVTQSGLEQLEEIRKGLGPARIKTTKSKS
jgi:protein LTV1